MKLYSKNQKFLDLRYSLLSFLINWQVTVGEAEGALDMVAEQGGAYGD